MDKILFNQPGGFPLTTNILNVMQNAYNLFNTIGYLAGSNHVIIHGCEQVGNTVTDGTVFINGEVYPLKGGVKTSSVKIVTETEIRIFEDGSQKTVLEKKHVTFGTGTNAIPWSDFKRYYVNQPIYKEVKWVGRDVTNDDLPRGWFIADGTKGTDNLLGRMFVGKDTMQPEFDTLLKKGGEKTHRLTIDEMPRHNHDIEVIKSNPEFENGDNSITASNNDDLLHYEKGELSTEYEGNDQPHNNLPPYIVMLPIQFIG